MALLNFCRLIVSTLRLMWRLLKFSWRNSVPLRAVTDQTAELLEEPLAAEALAPVAGALTLARAESAHLRPLGAAAAGLFTDPIARPLVRSSLTLAGEALRVTRANTTTVSGLANDVEQLLAAPSTRPLTEGAIALATRAVALAQSHPAELANLTNHTRLLLEDASLASSMIQLMSATAKAAATHSQRLETLGNEITTLLNSPQALLLQAGGIEAATAVAKLAGQSAADLTRVSIALRDLLQDPGANQLETNAIELTTRMLEVARTNSSALSTLADRLKALLSPTTPLAPSVFTLTGKSAKLFLTESHQLLTLLENSPALLEALGKGMVAAGNVGIAGGGALDVSVRAPIAAAAAAVSTSKSQIEGAVTTLNSVATGVSGLKVPTGVGLEWPSTGIPICVPNDNGPGWHTTTLTVPTGVGFSPTPVPAGPEFDEFSADLQALLDAQAGLEKLQKCVDPVVEGLYAAGTDARESGVALQQLSTAIENL